MVYSNTYNKSYYKLKVYLKAKDLVLLTYKITKSFPKEELYVLTPQMRRAAISIMANIVEGYVRSRKEFARFIEISIGSATELEVFFSLSLELKYIKRKDYSKVSNLLSEIKKLLYTYKRSLRREK